MWEVTTDNYQTHGCMGRVNESTLIRTLLVYIYMYMYTCRPRDSRDSIYMYMYMHCQIKFNALLPPDPVQFASHAIVFIHVHGVLPLLHVC